MFNFFPNTYVIFALYILAAFFYSRFESWLKIGYNELNLFKQGKIYRRARFNLILFSVVFTAAIILSIIDAIMSVYIIE